MTLLYEIVGGLVLLTIGGEMLLRGAISAAYRLGVSPLLIGITIVGFGTSAPELVTSLQAARLNSPGIAIGNIVGSNIANILLILGVAAVIAPITLRARGLVRDSIGLLASAGALCGIALNGGLTREASYVMLGLLVAYMIFAYFTEREAPRAEGEAKAPDIHLPLIAALALVALGLAGTIFGADFLVKGSIALAKYLGVRESIIGLSIVAVGTSLPELVASIIAVRHKHGAIAFGNIVGSNIYNAFAITGITGVVHPLRVPAVVAHFDLWVLLGATILLVVFTANGSRLTRSEGAILLFGYVVYAGALYARSAGLLNL